MTEETPTAQLPADLEPMPGDELASDEVAVADPLDEIPTAGGLAASVHGASAACDLLTRVVPEASSYVVLDAQDAHTLDGPTVCGATVLADGRLVAVLGYGTEQPQMSVIDPREPDGAFALPHDLGERQFIADQRRVVGTVEGTSEVVVTLPHEDDRSSGLEALDVDTGERRELVAAGELGDAGETVGAAYVREGWIVVVSGEASAMARDAMLRGLGHRGERATRIWLGPLDGSLSPIREVTPAPPTPETPPRDLLSPRIVDGPSGPLVVSFERPSSPNWQVVLTGPDGASRIVAELGDHTGGRSTAEQFVPDRLGLAGSLDAAGTQVLIAGSEVADGEARPVVLVHDLSDGSWGRVPIDANVAGFATAR